MSVKHYHRLKNFPGTWHLRSLISIKMTNQDTLLFSNQSINWLVHLSVSVFIIMFFLKTTNITISQERSTLKYDVFHSLPVFLFFLGSSIWAAVDWYWSMFFFFKRNCWFIIHVDDAHVYTKNSKCMVNESILFINIISIAAGK